MRNKFLKIALLYSIVILEYYLIENKIINVSYGKDGGLSFGISSICILSSFFFISNSKFSSNFFILVMILGFLSGILGCFLSYLTFLILSYLFYGDNRGLEISLFWDMIFAISIVVILGIIFNRFLNSQLPQASKPNIKSNRNL